MDTQEQTFRVIFTSEKKCGKINAQRKWLICPACNKQRLFLLLPTTRAENLPLWCKRCGKETVVDILPEPEP